MLIACSNNDQFQRLSSKNFVKIGSGVCINCHIVSHASKNSFEYLEGIYFSVSKWVNYNYYHVFKWYWVLLSTLRQFTVTLPNCINCILDLVFLLERFSIKCNTNQSYQTDNFGLMKKGKYLLETRRTQRKNNYTVLWGQSSVGTLSCYCPLSRTCFFKCICTFF